MKTYLFVIRKKQDTHIYLDRPSRECGCSRSPSKQTTLQVSSQLLPCAQSELNDHRDRLMKTFLFVIILGYMSIFPNAVYSNDDHDQIDPVHIDYSREPILWGLYDKESFLKSLIALFTTGLVIFWVTPGTCIGAVAGCCFCSGSFHVRALKGAAILGGLSACVFSPLAAVGLYNWWIGNVEGGSD